MEMKPRPQRRIAPESTFARVMTMALEQGKFHHLLEDALGGWSGQVAGALVGAVLKLPPARQLAARKELKSRFVDFMLSGAKRRGMKETSI